MEKRIEVLVGTGYGSIGTVLQIIGRVTVMTMIIIIYD
jgi:hypothetical protein